MWAEPTPAAPPASGGALALEALDEHGVVGDGRGVVDQPAQKLIVGGGPDTELAPDRLLLGAGVPPPLALEGEDVPLPFPERPGRGGVLLPCVVLPRLGPARAPTTTPPSTQDLVVGRTISATCCGSKPGREIGDS